MEGQAEVELGGQINFQTGNVVYNRTNTPEMLL